MRLYFGERFFLLATIGLMLGLFSSTWSSEVSGLKAARKMTHVKSNPNQNKSLAFKKIPCGSNCSKTSSGKRKIVILPHSDASIELPDSNSKMLLPFDETAVVPSVEHFKELADSFREKRKNCRRLKLIKKSTFVNFSCEKSKWISWFMNQLKKNSTDLFTPFVKLTPSASIKAESLTEIELMPENWPEEFVFRVIGKFGERTDKLFFHKFKEFSKSRELQVSIPHLVQLHVSPRTHLETGRTFFDPGFNLKLKLPFFHDELKFAVSTGPSFLAGLGVGIVVLGIKSIFAPFVLAFKAYLLSWFFKDMSPMDFMKAITGRWSSPVPEMSAPHGWEQAYEPPEVHSPYDSFGSDKKSAFGTISNMLSGSIFPSFDNPQYGHNPIQHGPPHRPHYDGHGRTQLKQPSSFSIGSDDGINGLRPPYGHDAHEIESEQDPAYVPSSALKEEVENFDPFYSPLLSRIDSIFMHLGFIEEGCKERAVCSIYKFPVKYAPYSNLLSAQLSKHQSELKRPVSTSPKILRYFKYMKAAKDGQASLNCIELYPKCTNDTEKLSSLPMVKTFQQLSELIGGTGSG